MSDVTQLLSAIDAGHPEVADELLPLVYDELRRLAASKMARDDTENNITKNPHV